MPRTIRLEITEACEEIILDAPAKFNVAIGYLAIWAHKSDSKTKLSIFGDPNGDLHATYENEQGEVTYTIFGQRGDDGSYSFHS